MSLNSLADDLHHDIRMQSEHPADEADIVIQRGRVLGGLEPTRAFGDARYKWSREVQERCANLNRVYIDEAHWYQSYSESTSAEHTLPTGPQRLEDTAICYIGACSHASQVGFFTRSYYYLDVSPSKPGEIYPQVRRVSYRRSMG